MAIDIPRALSQRPEPDPAGPFGEILNGVAPAVSVIIAAYDPGEHWREAISSAVAQTFADRKLTVVGDGSWEDLVWVPSIDPRVMLGHQRNNGVSTARNRGIAVSRARFIAFLDQDNLLPPTKFERPVKPLRNGSIFCRTAFYLIDNQGSRFRLGYGEKTSYWDMLAGRLGRLPDSSIVDRTVLQRVGSFDSQLPNQQDLDLFLHLSRSFVKRNYEPTVEVDYRQHAVNASKDYWVSEREKLDLYARQARLGPCRKETTVPHAIREGERRVRRTYASQAIDAARSNARIGCRMSAARHIVRATKPSPLVVQQSCGVFVKTPLGH